MADGVMERIETINNIPLCDTEARTLLESKANIDHTHDNYATKTELTTKANVTHTHSNYALKSDLTDIINRLTILESKYTEILTRLDDIEGGIVYPSVMYTITYGITEGITLSNTSTSITAGDRYVNTITYADGYTYDSIKIEMGGVDITSSITIQAPGPNQQGFAIEEVTGDLVIRITAKKEEIEIAIYNITYILETGITLDHQLSEIEQGASMEWAITCSNGYELDSEGCYITMGGVDVSSNVFHYDENNNIISIGIENITGNVNIVLASKSTIETYPCTSLTCYDEVYIEEGSDAPLGVEVLPSNCTDELSWVVSDESALSVYKVTESTNDGRGDVYAHAVTSGSYIVTFLCGDKMAKVTVVIGEKEEEVGPAVMYNITYYLTGGVSSDTQQQIQHGESFYTEITPTQSTLIFNSMQVTMGGNDITNTYCTMTDKKVTVNIPSVTGDLHIDARTVLMS